MEKVNTIFAIIILIIVVGCKGDKKSTDEFITVDITKSYTSKKELILQDFMDVEYIPLETNDNFVNQGFVMDMGKEIILVKNITNDGDIFIYDRHGKALRKFNRKGQGGEEYLYILNLALDEDKGEIFINDHYSQKIIVYDLFGNFKRRFKYQKNKEELFYTDMFNYDKDNLICYNRLNKEIGFVLVSKQDGSITKEIKIPFKEKKSLMKQLIDQSGGVYSVSPDAYSSIINFKGNWILTEYSSDTVYTLLPDYIIKPFIVRTPSIQSMNPEDFLVLRFFSDRYYFMETVRNEYNFDTREGFPTTSFIMYDKHENTFFGYNVYNGDFSTKKEIYMNFFTSLNYEIGSWYPLESFRLVESLKKGELIGKLKEIATTLDEESNRVIMLVKHKK